MLQKFFSLQFLIVELNLFHFLGEVVKVLGNEVNCDFMKPVNTSGSTRSLRKWPSNSDNETIHRNSVIPIKPCLDISKNSSHRLVIFELTNADLVQKFI